jgi:hypothetical protein
MGDVVGCVYKRAPGFKLARRDGVSVAAAHDCCLYIKGHRVGVAIHPAVRVRPSEGIFSPLGKVCLPMKFVFDRVNVLVVEVQLVPEIVAGDFHFDIPAEANAREVKSRSYVPQQRQVRIAHLFGVYLNI